MGRSLRTAAGDIIYHVVNRANSRLPIFAKPADYEAFERVVVEAHRREGTRILAYCVMPNHWHLVVWPRRDGELSRFVAWTTLTHAQRWHAHHGSAGSGHLYQGRFKSFPVQADEHSLTVCRYVERNALRAGLVARAEEWRWASLWQRTHTHMTPDWLATWPIDRPRDWLQWVNEPQSEVELDALRRSVQRGRPYGATGWVQETAQKLGLIATLRPRGRPQLSKHAIKVPDTFS